MSVHAEPIFWPESFEESEGEMPTNTRRKIVQFRHRVGEYDVTRLILDSREAVERPAK